ncbi:MAG: type II toxin-antitoxin system VapC family toxin [Treponema sp.]|nr:type II toxin-antitoxin system VapC family toxin [Treponema sp.]
MVIDSSALASALFGEEDAPDFIDALAAPGRKLMSAISRLEAGIVVEARKGEGGGAALSKLLVVAEVEVVAFDSSQAEVALDAWRRYGKGRHPAGLNLGDCASYALAKIANDSLLFKGSDFSKTDVTSAMR